MRRRGSRRSTCPTSAMPGRAPGAPGRPLRRSASGRAARARGRRGFDRLVVYADREHSANLSFLTGLRPAVRGGDAGRRAGRRPADPRGQRVLRDGRRRAAADAPRPVPGLQPARASRATGRGRSREILAGEGIGAGHAGRACSAGSRTRIRRGSRSRRSSSTSCGASWAAAARSTNANGLLIDPADGLRIINDVDQLAAFEHASCQTSDGVRRLLAGLRARDDRGRGGPAPALERHAAVVPPDADRRAAGRVRAAQPRRPADRARRAVHDGVRHLGRADLPGRLGGRGRAASCPTASRDYVDRLVAPYFAAVAEWYATLHVGQTGGALQDDHRPAPGRPVLRDRPQPRATSCTSTSG